MKKILIVTNRLLHKGPRIIREIEALKSHFEFYTIGLSQPHITPLKHWDRKLFDEPFTGRLLRLLKRRLLGIFVEKSYIFKSKYNALERVVNEVDPHILFCHEPYDLPYLVKLKEKYGFKLVFNAHEYFPLEFDDKPGWASTWQLYYEDIYRKTLPDVDLMLNVCESIREKCLTEFNKDSLVIANASIYREMEPKKVGNPIRIIHHGAAIESRSIELMIDVAKLLGDSYTMDLMLLPTEKSYYDKVVQHASTAKNVNLIEPVPFEEIVSKTNTYDIGMFLLPPLNYNYSIALPNKLYEFIQGRVAIAIGPSPEMARVVKEYGVGVISKDFTAKSLADEIKSCSTEQLFQFKQNANKAAMELSAETYSKILLDACLKLIN